MCCQEKHGRDLAPPGVEMKQVVSSCLPGPRDPASPPAFEKSWLRMKSASTMNHASSSPQPTRKSTDRVPEEASPYALRGLAKQKSMNSPTGSLIPRSSRRLEHWPQESELSARRDDYFSDVQPSMKLGLHNLTERDRVRALEAQKRIRSARCLHP
jgi:hypothetical protein